MKAIALTFNYNITGDNSLDSIGRHWAIDAYKNKEFIFKYSAAAYATFLHHHQNIAFDILTDDVSLMEMHLSQYQVNLNQVNFIDWSEELSIHKKYKYAFEPLIQLIKKYRDSNEYILKIDNDLIFKGELSLDEKKIAVWKYERNVKNGNPLWGEKHLCQKTVGTIDFDVYNIGLLGLPTSYWEIYEEYLETCYNMIDVDISDITDVNSEIYHCCEQTSHNYIFSKHGLEIQQTHNIVDHNFDNKEKCIEEAKYLLKEKQ